MTRNEARKIAHKVPGYLERARALKEAQPETFEEHYSGYELKLERDLQRAMAVLAEPVDPSIRLENI